MMLAKMVTHNGRPSRFFMIFIPSISFDNRFMVCYIYVKVLPNSTSTVLSSDWAMRIAVRTPGSRSSYS